MLLCLQKVERSNLKLATYVFANTLWGGYQDGNILYFKDADSFCIADLGLSRRMGDTDAVALMGPVYALLL